jgi:hypothetical protein
MTTARRSRLGLLLPAAAVVALVAVALSVGWSLLKNPFTTTEIDRSPPPVLTSLQSIAEFRAARANFEVLVDLEKDVKYLPSVLAGQRVLFVGVGSVDAYVDFSHLDQRAVTISEDGTGVRVIVPPPELSPAVIDPTQSHVIDRDTGLFDRLGNLISGDGGASEQDLYIAATQKMTESAKRAELITQAETSTRQMLTGLLEGLGFETVEIRFQTLPRPTE